MTAQPTAWDRAHAKSAGWRRANSVDVPAVAYRGMDGVWEAGLPGWMETRSPPPRAPTRYGLEATARLLRRWPDGSFLQAGRYAADGAWLDAGVPAYEVRYSLRT